MFKFQELIRANMVTLCLTNVLVAPFWISDAVPSLF
jgi:hypothetical protein